MNQYETANQIWKKFKEKEGSNHIASPVAIAALIKWLKYEKPPSILEIGAGIGTLTYSAVKTLNAISSKKNHVLICLENNDFCLRQLNENLSEFRKYFIVLPGIEALSVNPADFDFYIVDGGASDDPNLFSRLRQNSFVFIEGNREEQSKLLESVLTNRRYIKADVRNLRHGEKTNGGANGIKGYRIYKLNPTFTHRLIFLWLNLKTSFVYRWRLLKQKFDTNKHFQQGKS